MARLPVPVGSLVSTSSESMYQAAKFPNNPDLQIEILLADPRQAKALAYSCGEPPLPEWINLRRRVMLVAIRRKLTTHPEVASCLRDTGARLIVEVSRKDDFWGAVPMHEGLCGSNMLGRMWMSLRVLVSREELALDRWARRQESLLWPSAYD